MGGCTAACASSARARARARTRELPIRHGQPAAGEPGEAADDNKGGHPRGAAAHPPRELAAQRVWDACGQRRARRAGRLRGRVGARAWAGGRRQGAVRRAVRVRSAQLRGGQGRVSLAAQPQPTAAAAAAAAAISTAAVATAAATARWLLLPPPVAVAGEWRRASSCVDHAAGGIPSTCGHPVTTVLRISGENAHQLPAVVMPYGEGACQGWWGATTALLAFAGCCMPQNASLTLTVGKTWSRPCCCC